MGEWLSTGISASISDANIAAIADSVWFAGFAAHDGVAGSFGDSAKGWGATGAAGSVTDADMSAIMDSMSNRGIVQYDSSQATLQLTQLVVSNSGGDAVQFTSGGGNGHGLKLTANGSGEGLSSTGGLTGHGAHFTGGATSGHGILTQAGAGSNLDGIRALGDGSGEGLTAQGGTTGSGLLARSGGGATGDGAQFIAQSTNGNGLFLTATGTGIEITSDDLAAMCADSNWGADFEAHDGILGSFGDSAQAWGETGAAGSVTDGDMAAIMDSMSNRGIVQYDSTQAILKMAGLHLRAASNDTALIAWGAGSGHGAYFRSNTSGHGTYFRGGTTSGSGVLMDASGTGSSNGLRITATGANLPGLYAEGNKYGAEFLGRIPAGHGVYIHSDSGDGLQLSSATDDATAASKHALEILGHAGASSDAVAIRADGASSQGVSIWSDDSTGVEIIGSVTGGNGDGIHVTLGQGSGTGIVVDSNVVINDSLKTNLRSSVLGTGADTMVVWALDTSGTPALVSVVNITVKDLTGSDYAFGQTASNGSYKFFGTGVDTFLVTGLKVGYNWSHMGGQNAALADTVIMGATGGADTLVGSDIAFGSSGSPTIVRVKTFVQDIQGNGVKRAKLKMTLQNTQATDTCSNVILGRFSAQAYTGANGSTFVDVVATDCILPATSYKWEIFWPNSNKKRHGTITVPSDSAAGGYYLAPY
jgi:hypothetical protein